MGIAPRDITGFCIGEHGDSQTLVWSQTKAGAVPVDTLLTREQMDTIEKDTVEAGCKIVLSKGSTEFGIGISASEIIQAILGEEQKVLTCSVDPAGRYGQKDLYTSVPCIVSKEGAKPMPEVPLTEENDKFQKSCEMLKGLIAAKNMKIK